MALVARYQGYAGSFLDSAARAIATVLAGIVACGTAAGRILVIAGLLLAAMATLPAQALEPSEKLADPALEERARDLSAELRCLVCQNQSIDDSDAPLARDLRLLVRERLVAGDSNAEVKSFIVARYGDFVLLKPPFNTHTFLLWLTPLIVLLLVGFTVFRASRRQQARQATAVAELSADEQRRLGDVLKRYE